MQCPRCQTMLGPEKVAELSDWIHVAACECQFVYGYSTENGCHQPLFYTFNCGGYHVRITHGGTTEIRAAFTTKHPLSLDFPLDMRIKENNIAAEGEFQAKHLLSLDFPLELDITEEELKTVLGLA